jgi:hypothetical protein
VLTVERVDETVRRQRRRFVDLPLRLYGRHPQWVPAVSGEAEALLDRRRHPFYEHSTAEFLVAVRDGQVVGRLAVQENRRFNAHRRLRQAHFSLFECENDAEAAAALFARGFEWARGRGLNEIVGPRGLGALDGYGLLVDGFEHRAAMTMAPYNPAYYATLLEGQGFGKAVDYGSWYMDIATCRLPAHLHATAERARRRGHFQVASPTTAREIRRWAPRIGAAYNAAFAGNWEYHPLTERELQFLVDSLRLLAQPGLVHILLHRDEVAGFLLAFPDVSAALQRTRGRLLPFGLLDLWLEIRRTPWLAMNGVGVLPPFRGRGGLAMLFEAMERDVLAGKQYRHADMTQVAETAPLIQSELRRMGLRPYKNHRVYARPL